MDLTDPTITQIVDGLSRRFIDQDYTNVLDCVFVTLEIDDPESPVDYMNISVRRFEGEDIVTETRFDYCNNKTFDYCIPGKVRLTNVCTYHCAH